MKAALDMIANVTTWAAPQLTMADVRKTLREAPQQLRMAWAALLEQVLARRNLLDSSLDTFARWVHRRDGAEDDQ